LAVATISAARGTGSLAARFRTHRYNPHQQLINAHGFQGNPVFGDSYDRRVAVQPPTMGAQPDWGNQWQRVAYRAFLLR